MAITIAALTPLLFVFDMAESVGFYLRRGFGVVNTSGKADFEWAMLRLNDVTIRLNTQFEPDEGPAQRDAARDKAHADSVIYIGCQDVGAFYEFATAKGLKPDKPVLRHYGFREVELRDPDGFILCFQEHASTRSA